MKHMYARILKVVKEYPQRALIVGAVVVVIGGIFIFSGNGAAAFDTAVVGNADITQVVSVTGKVTPVQKADLAFEKGGLLAKISVKVGDHVVVGQILGALDMGEAFANYRGAQANLLGEEARLDEVAKGTRPEELTLTSTQASNATQSYTDAQNNLAVAIRDAYVKTDDAGRNKTSVFFQDGETQNPIMTVRNNDQTVEYGINDKKLRYTQMLKKWNTEIAQIGTSTDYTVLSQNAQANITQAKIFLDALAAIVNSLTINNSGLSQATIDTYRGYVTAAQVEVVTGATNLSNAVSAMTSARSALSVADNQLTLKQSGSTPQSIKAQEAKVAQAQASVLANQSLVAKSSIVSPIDGIVSRVVPDIGEIIPSGSLVFSVMSDDAYEIEVQVPEADIAKIAVGNTAKISLDAYGSDVVFSGKVILIDPAETLVEGVPTYKVTLQFDDKDSRVRSGMTANIEIVTATRTDVLAAPTRAIIDRGQTKVVRIPQGSGFVEQSVTTGLKGSDGMTEILNGLAEGDQVVTFVK